MFKHIPVNIKETVKHNYSKFNKYQDRTICAKFQKFDLFSLKVYMDSRPTFQTGDHQSTQKMIMNQTVYLKCIVEDFFSMI